MVRLPVVARLEALMVRVDVPEPGEAMELGLKVAVSPLPKPDAESVTAALIPLATVVMVVEPDELLSMVRDVGEAEIDRLAVVVEVTVSETVVFAVVLPLVPVMVML
jgi:hypothetical protein